MNFQAKEQLYLTDTSLSRQSVAGMNGKASQDYMWKDTHKEKPFQAIATLGQIAG